MSLASQPISIVIPAYNAADTLPQCLDAIANSGLRPAEVIVVNDGSTDETARIAERFGAIVVSTDKRSGPAAARNLGAEAARYDLLLFIDADVTVSVDAIGKIEAAFIGDPELSGLIGSYDFAPSGHGFVSHYRNLLHSFVHQHGRRRTIAFWGACGAVRKRMFFEVGGFDVAYTRPSIEDIELGYRLRNRGLRVELDPAVQVKHLKHWTLIGMIRTDIFDRAIPWTRLMLREGDMPNDLNLRWGQRLCVALVMAAPVVAPLDWGLASLFVLAVIVMNWRFYAFLGEKWGWANALLAIPLHLTYFFYSGVGLGLGILAHVLGRCEVAYAPEQELK